MGFSATTRRPVPSHRRHWVLAGTALFMAALLLYHQAALSFLGSLLIHSQQPQRADLILVLGGDFWGPRVIKAAELGRLGYAPLVLLSSPPYAGRPEGELAVDFLVKQGYSRRDFTVFPHQASSTIAEALALRPELLRRQARTVILVTSAYHSRRAAIVFRLFCPHIRFISVPAPDSVYQAQTWWKRDGSRELFFSEWVKILGTLTIAYPRYLVNRLATSSAELFHSNKSVAVV